MRFAIGFLLLCLPTAMGWADPTTKVEAGVQYQQTASIWGEAGQLVSLDEASALSGAVFSLQSIFLKTTWKLSFQQQVMLSWEPARNLRLSGDVFDQGEPLGRRSEGSSGMGDPSISWWSRSKRSPRYTLWRGLSLRIPLGSSETRLPLGQGLPSAAVSWRLASRSPAEPHMIETSVLTQADGFPAVQLRGEKTFLFELSTWKVGFLAQKALRPKAANAPQLREILAGVAPGQSQLSLSTEVAYPIFQRSVFAAVTLPLWAEAQGRAVVWQLGLRP